MIYWAIFAGTLLYHLVGMVAAAAIVNADDFEGLFNPKWIYFSRGVNYFGCTMLTLLTHILCPLGAFCYWFYVVCTVGRK